MAVLEFVHAPILQNPAQLIVLPVNNAGVILDPVIARCKTLYPDNYQQYRKRCLDGTLAVGSSLLVKRQRDRAGLSVSGNGNQPSYLANLIVSDHPYHPPRQRWLISALDDLYHQLYSLMRYEGLRHIALLARPLIYPSQSSDSNQQIRADATDTVVPRLTADLKAPVLDWHQDIMPLLIDKFAELPKTRMTIHLPVDISTDPS